MPGLPVQLSVAEAVPAAGMLGLQPVKVVLAGQDVKTGMVVSTV